MKLPGGLRSHSSTRPPHQTPPHQGACLKLLTTHELIRPISTVREGVALLLDEDALATGAPELIWQTDSCGGKGAVLRGARGQLLSRSNHKGLIPNADPTAEILSRTQPEKIMENPVSLNMTPVPRPVQCQRAHRPDHESKRDTLMLSLCPGGVQPKSDTVQSKKQQPQLQDEAGLSGKWSQHECHFLSEGRLSKWRPELHESRHCTCRDQDGLL